MTNVPTQRATRRPTGRPAWPFLHLSGIEKSGKTWSLLEFSGTPLVGRFLYIPFGEFDADEYGAIPGANFEIVPTDGTYVDLLAAVEWAVTQPPVDGKPVAVAVDSGSELWGLLGDEQNIIARQRAAEKSARPNADPKLTKQATGEVEPDVTMDQWNLAKSRWNRIVALLRRHEGPSFITSRLEEVTIVDGRGLPTKQTKWKSLAEKNLGYAVTGTVQFREYRKAILTGMHSVTLAVDPDDVRRLPNFTIAGLFEQMRVNAETVGTREAVQPNAEVGAAQIRSEQAQVEQEAVLPGVDVVAQAIQDAMRAPVEDRASALRAVGNRFTAGALARVTLRVQGQDFKASDYLRQLIADAAEAAGKTARAPVADALDHEVLAGGARAEQVTGPAPAVRAPAVERAAVALEDARQATYAQRASTGDDLLRERLVEELKHVAPLVGLADAEIAGFLIAQKKDRLDDVSPLALRRYVFGLRPRAIAALREQARASEATAYEAARGIQAVLTWDGLVGTGEQAQSIDA